MSLTLNIQTEIQQLDNGQALCLFDITGVNDGTNYPYGWSDGVNGLNNPQISDINQVEITIDYGGVIYSIIYTGSDLADYLNPMIGKTFNVADVLGATYEYYEDGFYTITIEFSGPTIQGSSQAWVSDDEFIEAFLWSTRNKVGQFLAEIQVPIVDYVDALNAGILNCLLDDIMWLCQYGDATKAKEVLDYLTSVLNNETKLTELFKNYKNY